MAKYILTGVGLIFCELLFIFFASRFLFSRVIAIFTSLIGVIISVVTLERGESIPFNDDISYALCVMLGASFLFTVWAFIFRDFSLGSNDSEIFLDLSEYAPTMLLLNLLMLVIFTVVALLGNVWIYTIISFGLLLANILLIILALHEEGYI